MIWIIISSVLLGVVITLAIQAYLIRKHYSNLPKLNPPFREQVRRYALPKPLRDLLEEIDVRNRKESPLCLNLIFQFMFKEMKDSPGVRKWLSDKMNVEFEELLHTTTGKLVDSITVRDFSVGDSFPVIKSASVRNIVPHHDHLSIDELEVLIDLDYHGGFQLSVDIDLVFGKSAYLSVTMTHLQGSARIQLSRLPFTHWSFAFIDDPTIEFEVSSQFEGRPMPQITSLIINQIRRTIRKKHTLPNYKIRFKPFFNGPEPPHGTRAHYLFGKKLTVGQLEVTVMECGRLQPTSSDCSIFCTLSIDHLPWKQLMNNRRKRWTSHDIDMTKVQSQALGLLFKEEFMLDRYENVVVIDLVNSSLATPNDLDIRKSDIVVAVNGIRVTSIKQAMKLFKQAGEKFSLRLERANARAQEHLNYDENTVYMRSDNFDIENAEEVEEEEFINISLRENGESEIQNMNTNHETASSGTGVSSSSATSSSQDLPKQEGKFSFLTAGSQFLQRRRSRDERSTSPSPRDSPEPHRRSLANFMKKSPERRTHSDGDIDVPKNFAPKDNGADSKENSPPPNDDGNSSALPNVPSTSSMQNAIPIPNSTTQKPVFPGSPEKTLHEKSEPFLEESHTPFDFRSFGLLKTGLVAASVEPYWDESFNFDVEEQHEFLNVCIWCRNPEKLDKHNRVIKPEKDSLIGYASVNLMQVATECMLTLQRDTQQTHMLTPPDQKPGAARNKSSIGTHPGYDDRIAHGDVTLAFLYNPHSVFSTPERPRARERSPLKMNNEPKRENISECHSPKRTVGGPSKLEEGRHDFLGMTFHSATFCRFCGKKIWLKVAFQCRNCAMICHKKCTEKCQAQTKCTKDGPIPKVPSQPLLEVQKEVSKPEEAKPISSGPLSKSAALLSRFTKRESPKPFRREIEMEPMNSAKSTPTHTLRLPQISIDRRRHNSAPDNEEAARSLEVLVTKDDQCIPSSNKLEPPDLPRTRSTASLEDLMKENALGASTLKPAEVVFQTGASPNVSSGESSDDDEEDKQMMKMMQFQPRTHEEEELVVTAAKKIGKELFSELSLGERREKLDTMISKLQNDIDQESDERSELVKLEREATDPKERERLRACMEKSDEKIQAVAVMMLHYCAGLQHCLDLIDQEERKEEKAKKENEEEEMKEEKNEDRKGNEETGHEDTL